MEGGLMGVWNGWMDAWMWVWIGQRDGIMNLWIDKWIDNGKGMD